jgi:hypothetical protein
LRDQATDGIYIQLMMERLDCSELVQGSLQTGHTTLSSTLYRQLENQAPNTTGRNHLYNTLELMMMGIMVPETC